MLRAASVALLAVLAGCSNPVADAEDRHAMEMKAALYPRDKCEAERRLQAAYLEAKSEKFEHQKMAADNICWNADHGF